MKRFRDVGEIMLNVWEVGVIFVVVIIASLCLVALKIARLTRATRKSQLPQGEPCDQPNCVCKRKVSR